MSYYIPDPSYLAKIWVNCKDQNALREAFAAAIRLSRDSALDYAADNAKIEADPYLGFVIDYQSILSGKTSPDLQID